MRKLLITASMILAFAFNVWAGTNTTNLQLYKPAQGEVNWANSVNSNFNTLDTAVGTKLNANGTFKTGAIGLSDLPVGGATMTYPSSGIPTSTGAAWGSSITDNSTAWNTVGNKGNLVGGNTWQGDQTYNGSATYTGTGTNTFPDLIVTNNFTAGDVSPAEISYLDGVTSAIQTQLNTKGSGTSNFTADQALNTTSSPTFVNVSVSRMSVNGTGTNEFGASNFTGDVELDGNFTKNATKWNSGDSIDGEVIAADTIDDDSIDFADVTLADLTFDVGSVDTTEYGYLNGVTSALQTQLNAKEGDLANSAGLAAALSDETGTGLAVFATSPALTTPNIGAAVGTSITLSGAGTTTFPNMTVTDTLTVNNVSSTATGATELLIYEADGFSTTITQGATLAANISASLPPDDGDAGEQLQTDGAGVWTWEAAGGTILKDLVTTAPLTGGTNDILPGADADITVALDMDAVRLHNQTKSFAVYNITADYDIPLPRIFPNAAAIKAADFITVGGTNITVALERSAYPADGNYTNTTWGTIMNATLIVGNTNTTITAFNNATIAANDNLRVNVTSVNGAMTFFSGSIKYDE